jgi:ectoine hydroxylase-related dioxygenase (phytanoyl-CoA dioxygenase family)
MASTNVALPDLSSLYHVPHDAVAGIASKGHTCLRGVATADEIAAFRPVIEEVARANTTETRPLEERDTYGKAFIQVMNLWRKDERVARFVLAKRFAKVAADLLDVPGVRLYHDQALFKEAGGGKTPWHQDQYFWPFDTDKTITMWMPLVPVPVEVGSMIFTSGTHTMGYLGRYGISDESEEVFKNFVAEKSIPLESYGALEPGDTTWHVGWSLHAAPENPTQNLRAVMTVIYVADGARVIEPLNDNQKVDLVQWLPGLQPGDPVASELNPLLYP